MEAIPYKHCHGMEVNNAARLEYSSFEMQEFPQFLPKIQNNAFKSQTVQSGFSDSGIYLFNPEPILEALHSQTAPKSTSTCHGAVRGRYRRGIIKQYLTFLSGFLT